ncbi:MAG TPA: hypothetical protein PKL97_09655, partial [Candidatus Omnitrophota bacterium]|nr:hypothetical protein [Candidatus Omnitrophota bacterium]
LYVFYEKYGKVLEKALGGIEFTGENAAAFRHPDSKQRTVTLTPDGEVEIRFADGKPVEAILASAEGIGRMVYDESQSTLHLVIGGDLFEELAGNLAASGFDINQPHRFRLASGDAERFVTFHNEAELEGFPWDGTEEGTVHFFLSHYREFRKAFETMGFEVAASFPGQIASFRVPSAAADSWSVLFREPEVFNITFKKAGSFVDFQTAEIADVFYDEETSTLHISCLPEYYGRLAGIFGNNNMDITEAQEVAIRPAKRGVKRFVKFENSAEWERPSAEAEPLSGPSGTPPEIPKGSPLEDSFDALSDFFSTGSGPSAQSLGTDREAGSVNREAQDGFGLRDTIHDSRDTVIASSLGSLDPRKENPGLIAEERKMPGFSFYRFRQPSDQTVVYNYFILIFKTPGGTLHQFEFLANLPDGTVRGLHGRGDGPDELASNLASAAPRNFVGPVVAILPSSQFEGNERGLEITVDPAYADEFSRAGIPPEQRLFNLDADEAKGETGEGLPYRIKIQAAQGDVKVEEQTTDQRPTTETSAADTGGLQKVPVIQRLRIVAADYEKFVLKILGVNLERLGVPADNIEFVDSLEGQMANIPDGEQDVFILRASVTSDQRDRDYRLIRDLRAKHPNALILTYAARSLDYHVGIFEAGADAFVSVPFDPEEILGWIRKYAAEREAEEKDRDAEGQGQQAGTDGLGRDPYKVVSEAEAAEKAKAPKAFIEAMRDRPEFEYQRGNYDGADSWPMEVRLDVGGGQVLSFYHREMGDYGEDLNPKNFCMYIGERQWRTGAFYVAQTGMGAMMNKDRKPESREAAEADRLSEDQESIIGFDYPEDLHVVIYAKEEFVKALAAREKQTTFEIVLPDGRTMTFEFVAVRDETVTAGTEESGGAVLMDDRFERLSPRQKWDVIKELFQEQLGYMPLSSTQTGEDIWGREGNSLAIGFQPDDVRMQSNDSLPLEEKPLVSVFSKTGILSDSWLSTSLIFSLRDAEGVWACTDEQGRKVVVVKRKFDVSSGEETVFVFDENPGFPQLRTWRDVAGRFQGLPSLVPVGTEESGGVVLGQPFAQSYEDIAKLFETRGVFQRSQDGRDMGRRLLKPDVGEITWSEEMRGGTNFLGRYLSLRAAFREDGTHYHILVFAPGEGLNDGEMHEGEMVVMDGEPPTAAVGDRTPFPNQIRMQMKGFQGVEILDGENGGKVYVYHWDEFILPEQAKLNEYRSFGEALREHFFSGTFENGDEYRIVAGNTAAVRKALGLPERPQEKIPEVSGSPGIEEPGQTALQGETVETFTDFVDLARYLRQKGLDLTDRGVHIPAENAREFNVGDDTFRAISDDTGLGYLLQYLRDRKSIVVNVCDWPGQGGHTYRIGEFKLDEIRYEIECRTRGEGKAAVFDIRVRIYLTEEQLDALRKAYDQGGEFVGTPVDARGNPTGRESKRASHIPSFDEWRVREFPDGNRAEMLFVTENAAPMGQSADAGTGRIAGEKLSYANLRVLSADDDEHIAKFSARKAIGWGVPEDGASYVTSDLEFERALREGQFDVIVTDLLVDKVLTQRFLRAYKELNPDCLIILTSDFLVEDFEALKADLGAIYMSKPFSPEELKTIIDRYIEEMNSREDSAAEGSDAGENAEEGKAGQREGTVMIPLRPATSAQKKTGTELIKKDLRTAYQPGVSAYFDDESRVFSSVYEKRFLAIAVGSVDIDDTVNDSGPIYQRTLSRHVYVVDLSKKEVVAVLGRVITSSSPEGWWGVEKPFFERDIKALQISEDGSVLIEDTEGNGFRWDWQSSGEVEEVQIKGSPSAAESKKVPLAKDEGQRAGTVTADPVAPATPMQQLADRLLAIGFMEAEIDGPENMLAQGRSEGIPEFLEYSPSTEKAITDRFKIYVHPEFHLEGNLGSEGPEFNVVLFDTELGTIRNVKAFKTETQGVERDGRERFVSTVDIFFLERDSFLLSDFSEIYVSPNRWETALVRGGGSFVLIGGYDQKIEVAPISASDYFAQNPGFELVCKIESPMDIEARRLEQFPEEVRRIAALQSAMGDEADEIVGILRDTNELKNVGEDSGGRPRAEALRFILNRQLGEMRRISVVSDIFVSISDAGRLTGSSLLWVKDKEGKESLAVFREVDARGNIVVTSLDENGNFERRKADEVEAILVLDWDRAMGIGSARDEGDLEDRAATGPGEEGDADENGAGRAVRSGLRLTAMPVAGKEYKATLDGIFEWLGDKYPKGKAFTFFELLREMVEFERLTGARLPKERAARLFDRIKSEKTPFVFRPALWDAYAYKEKFYEKLKESRQDNAEGAFTEYPATMSGILAFMGFYFSE